MNGVATYDAQLTQRRQGQTTWYGINICKLFPKVTDLTRRFKLLAKLKKKMEMEWFL